MRNLIWNKVETKKLRVVEIYKNDLKGPLTEFGRTNKNYAKFGAFYELYLFGFVIGYHNNKRFTDLENEKLDTFNTIVEWRNTKKTILKNFFAALLCNEKIKSELELDFNRPNVLSDEEIDIFVKRLLLVFEEYANAGLQILHKKYLSNPDDFGFFNSLQIMHEKVLKNEKPF